MSETHSISEYPLPEALKKKILELEVKAIGDAFKDTEEAYNQWRGIMLTLDYLGIPCPEELHGSIHPIPSMGPREVKQVIVMRSDLQMTAGKEDAQAAHASGAFVFDQLRTQTHEFSLKLSLAEKDWIDHSYSKIVVIARSEEELLEVAEKAARAGIKVHKIVDSGQTQFHGHETLTCIALGPDYAVNLDPITGGMRLR